MTYTWCVSLGFHRLHGATSRIQGTSLSALLFPLRLICNLPFSYGFEVCVVHSLATNLCILYKLLNLWMRWGLTWGCSGWLSQIGGIMVFASTCDQVHVIKHIPLKSRDVMLQIFMHSCCMVVQLRHVMCFVPYLSVSWHKVLQAACRS